MKTFTIDDIRSWNPCYDPKRYLAADWTGTVIDILEHEEIPPQDKLWVVCREELIDAKTLRLFAVWCVRQIEHLLTDERSKNALNVVERFAHGEATEEELSAARDDAWTVAEAWTAARVTKYVITTEYAVLSIAWATEDAARTVARYAAWATEDTARAAAAQVSKLIEMIKEPKEPTK